MKGVLDRIENGKAIILVEQNNDEFIISADKLPTGSKPGTWYQLRKNGTYEIMKIDHFTTKQKQKNTTLLMEKLQQKKAESKYKRR